MFTLVALVSCFERFFFSLRHAQPWSVSGGLEVAAEAVFLSGLLLASLWDRRSGTRGLHGPDGLTSPGSLNKSRIYSFMNCF